MLITFAYAFCELHKQYLKMLDIQSRKIQLQTLRSSISQQMVSNLNMKQCCNILKFYSCSYYVMQHSSANDNRCI